MKPYKTKSIMLVFVIAIGLWVVDAMVDVHLFWKPPFTHAPDLTVAVHAAYTDLITLVYLIAFGLVVLRYVRKFNESETRYSQLINNISDLIYVQSSTILNDTSRFNEVNEAVSKELGYGHQELMQLSPANIILPDMIPELSVTTQALLEKKHIIYQTILVAKDGRKLPVEIKAHIVNIQGKPTILSIARDITEQKRTEAALIRAKEEWESTFDAVPDLIAIIDENYRLIRVNRAMAAALGAKPEELAGRHCYEIMHGSPSPPPFCPHCRLLKDGQHHAVEVHEFGRDFLVSASPLLDRQGVLFGSVHVARDITKLKRTKEILRQSEARFRAIFERAAIGIGFLDLEGRFFGANNAMQEHFGYTQQELSGRHFSELCNPNELAKDLELFAELTAGQRDYYQIENRCICKNRELIWCLKIASLVRDSDGKPQFVIAMLENIETRKIAEEALQEAYNKLEKRVEERTWELNRANYELQREVKERTQAEAALRESEQHLRTLTAQILSAGETERQRIATELHDELGQTLMILKFKLSSFIDSVCIIEEDFTRDYKILLDYLDGVIENVRRLSRDLSTSVLDELGLSSALRYLLDEFVKHFHIASSSIEMDEIDQLFSPEIQLNIYRIFQEILTNIARHAQAQSIAVDIRKHDSSVAFVVEDSGKGFDVSQIADHKPLERRIGLAAMQERVRIARGSLELWSQEGSGTRITFSIPINRHTNEHIAI